MNTHAIGGRTRGARGGTGCERREAGFSLIELMVAMAVTTIMAGSIYQMMAMGDSAFKREPELTERQQNIRIAMDMIQRDVATAGAGQSQWAQAFGRTNFAGALLNGGGPPAPQGINADALEIFGSSGSCPPMVVFNQSGVNLDLTGIPPACYAFPVLVGLSWTPGPAPDTGQGYGFACQGGGGAGGLDKINFPPGQAPGVNWPGGGGLPQNYPATMSVIEIVKYVVANDADGIPSLWRSPRGEADGDGSCGPGAGGAGGAGGCPNIAGAPGPCFQIVARGIEDLQVVYTMADGTRTNTPALVTTNNWASLVREVEVTLVARVMQARIEGSTVSATTSFRRGNMVSSIVPRAVLATLRTTGNPYEWH